MPGIRGKSEGIKGTFYIISISAVLGLRSNQAEPSYEKPDQLNRKEFVD